MPSMESKIITVLGGARSGKSTFAQELVEKLARPTVYIATAQNKDEEMAERILQHQAARPKTWRTIEAPYDLAAAIEENSSKDTVILVDCVTLFLSNLLLRNLGDLGTEDNPRLPQSLEVELLKAMGEVVLAAQSSASLVVFVSNEIGSGVVPLYHSARMYRDIVGKANQLLARYSQKVFYVYGGIPLDLKSLGVSLDQICEELNHAR